jgi:LPXTG-site transpeptidase (sortase) family protein
MQRGQRVSRRAFVGLALSGLLMAACQKQQVVYVSAPTPTPEAPPAPAVAPTLTPTPAPKPESKPTAAAQGPIQLPVPVAAGPVAALAAQSQVIPPIQPRTRPYTNRLQVPERLQIPTIDLDSKVVPIGTRTDDKGHILWETAAFAVGHHKGTGLPGETGNVVLSGHISSPREGAVFNKLPKVGIGDGIVVSTADRQFLYVVVETKTVTPDQVDVLDPTDESMVTMITCVPDGIYSHRLIVRAEAV